MPGLFEKVHPTRGASGVFPLGGIRSRGVRLDRSAFRYGSTTRHYC
ncbi:hypothetical protein [Pseudomonas sp. H2_E02]